ncbi:Centromere-associated protein NUF2 [Ectocarpus siliculosus]|uniref:Centromere-associated protein NUF2 n=1 Tax=Ectocarpus siliculosus TaxID=2880 RepID=D8LMS3_ECTSI|nr:Centromere-associated protein NUF2 [Ectocarpus siliculosus]|eukprot:CBN74724.1 Centromere-associated protein NUF2 [Ectocarpus siliculosus]
MADGADVAYSFPMLNSKKIVGYLGDLNIHVSEQMLASPKDHVPQLTMLFERLVETTLGVTKEEMSQPVFAGLGCLTYPELHDESIAFLALFRNVCRMMRISRIEDFALKDMSDPNQKRLRRQLSAVINFVRFKEGKEHLYLDAMAKKQRLAAAVAAAQQRNNKLQEEHEDIQDRMAEKNKAIEAVNAKHEAAKQKTVELTKSVGTAREELARVKKDNNDIKDRVATAQATLNRAELEKKNLQAQVVSSPKRILREVSDLQQSLEQELSEVEAETRKAQSFKHSVVVMNKARRELAKATANIEEAATELSKQESAMREVKNTQYKIHEKRNDFATRSSEKAELQRRLVRFEEKLAHLRKQAAFKTEAMAGEMEAIRAAIAENEAHYNEAHARMEESQAVLDQYRQEKENVEAEVAKNVSDTKELLTQIGGITGAYARRLQAAMRDGEHHPSTVLT